MTITELAAIAIAAVAVVVAVSQITQVRSMKRRLSAIPEDGSVFDSLRRLDDDLASAEEEIARLRPVVESLAERMPGAICHTGVVTYDANQDMAGRLSRSIALLNEHGDGLVITLLRGRSEVIYYTKMIRGGRGTEPLSPEETAVITAALER